MADLLQKVADLLQDGMVEGDELDATPQTMRIGATVVLATCTAAGVYEWWAGRVEKMRRKSSRSTRFLDTSDPVPFREACSSNMNVICTWYKRHARYTFTYDGPIDDGEYSLEFALGLLDLELPDSAGKCKLRDPAQGPQFDAALKLTELPRGKKKTRGEEQLAREAQQARESSTWLQPGQPKRPRRIPTVRI